jgi:predicted membrane protein
LKHADDPAVEVAKADGQALCLRFATRWNVVIGGQLFSKSFLGYTTYKVGFATREGLLPAFLVLLVPLGILAVLVKLLPPWTSAETHP